MWLQTITGYECLTQNDYINILEGVFKHFNSLISKQSSQPTNVEVEDIESDADSDLVEIHIVDSKETTEQKERRNIAIFSEIFESIRSQETSIKTDTGTIYSFWGNYKQETKAEQKPTPNSHLSNVQDLQRLINDMLKSGGEIAAYLEEQIKKRIKEKEAIKEYMKPTKTDDVVEDTTSKEIKPDLKASSVEPAGRATTQNCSLGGS